MKIQFKNRLLLKIIKSCVLSCAILVTANVSALSEELSCTCMKGERTFHIVQVEKPETLSKTLFKGCSEVPTRTIEVDDGFFKDEFTSPGKVIYETDTSINSEVSPNRNHVYQYFFNKKTGLLRIYVKGGPSRKAVGLDSWNVGEYRYQCK